MSNATGVTMDPEIKRARNARQCVLNARALASCISDGLLNPASRPHYDELTISEMILAVVDAALADRDDEKAKS